MAHPALIVEDGSLVADADSYITRDDFVDYCLHHGITMPDNTTTDEHLHNAFTYINSLESRLKGTKYTRDQTGAYPRTELWIDDYSWSATEIPTQVINLQSELAIQLHQGLDVYNPAPSASTPVKRKRIEGALEIEYAVSERASFANVSYVDSLKASLCKRNGLFSIGVSMA